MNKKGFAISSILYLLILITGLLLASVLGVVTFRKNVLVSRINNINAELNGDFITQYRYMTENGEWSTWLDYTDINNIDYSFTLNSVPNIGTSGKNYNLTLTNITLDIVDGKASLKFNGTSSKAVSGTGIGVVANTILLEVYKQSNGVIAGINSNQQGIYYDSATKLNIKDTTNTEISSTTYASNTTGDTYKYVLILDKSTGNYKIYEDGTLVGTTGSMSTYNITSLNLGCFPDSTSFFTGNIYKVAFSSKLTSPSEAKEMSKLSGSSQEDILLNGNAEIKYGPYIEYRKISSKEKLTSSDVFRTRYIRDYMNNTITTSNNQILDIGVYTRFQKANKFNNMMIGGSYTGSYTKNTDYNNNPSLGKIRVSNGIFTHANTKTFTLPSTMEVLTPYTTTSSFGSNLLAFIGSDATRFPTTTYNSFNGFVVVDYSDKDNNGNNEWNYYNGTTWAPFTPNNSDAIVGYISKISSASSTDVNMFSTSFSFNIALGKSIISSTGTIADANGTNISTILDGKVQTSTYFINGTKSQYVEIDLGAEYDVTNVNVFHQYSTTTPITTLGTKTILYSSNKARTYTLWDYSTKGLYTENMNGMGITFYVNSYLMPNTYKTRYIRDEVNGKQNLTTNTSDSSSTWVEISAYDPSGYNIALNKKATTTGLTASIGLVTDGNNTNVYTAGTGKQIVTIDLGYEYAIKEVNIIHNVGNYSYLNAKTTLINSSMNYSNVIYNSDIDGLYKELTGGIRIPNKIVIKEKETNLVPIEFGYSGTSAAYIIPTTGKYKLEVWGAEGGIGYSDVNYQAVGGAGGYASGEITLTAGDVLNIYVGGRGTDGSTSSVYSGGYNGGGAGQYNAGGGGGATDIRRGGTDLASRIIVAGAGGGGQGYSSYTSNGGYGGGTTGGSASNHAYWYGTAGYYVSTGGTQTAGGTGNSSNGPGSLGAGGNYPTTYTGGGGSGYYGGAAGTYNGCGGAGGSSYVSNAFTNTQNIAGNANIPAPSGGTETGHSGGGYARITYLGQ